MTGVLSMRHQPQPELTHIYLAEHFLFSPYLQLSAIPCRCESSENVFTLSQSVPFFFSSLGKTATVPLYSWLEAGGKAKCRLLSEAGSWECCAAADSTPLLATLFGFLLVFMSPGHALWDGRNHICLSSWCNKDAMTHKWLQWCVSLLRRLKSRNNNRTQREAKHVGRLWGIT